MEQELSNSVRTRSQVAEQKQEVSVSGQTSPLLIFRSALRMQLCSHVGKGSKRISVVSALRKRNLTSVSRGIGYGGVLHTMPGENERYIKGERRIAG